MKGYPDFVLARIQHFYRSQKL